MSEQEEREARRICGGKMVEEELKALGSEPWQFQKEALARERLDGPVQVETLEARRCREKRGDAAGRDPAAQDRQETTATFVLDPQAPLLIALLMGTGYARLELGGKRRLDLDPLLGLFCGCERRGAFRLACDLYRPSLCTVL
jgi:hypothetical protein